MPKQTACQKFIFKIHSSRLRNAKWKLTLPLEEARRNDEVIAIADSQVLRWIDELNGVTNRDERAREILHEIRQIRKLPNSVQNKRDIRKLYAELDELQFQPDYMTLIIDKEKDYHRACHDFSINNVTYKRLLGTNGGIKNSTIVFVSDRLHDELERRVNNDRNERVEMVTAKLEAHRALSCSASIPVSMPNGILVVNDCETTFLSDILYLTDECEGEPIIEERENEEVTIDASDGFGLMLPSLAERWSRELGLDYLVGGVNTRFAYEKGMVFTFDFLDFAENVAERQYIVRDVWGAEVDVRNVEIILTTSMVKLWESYGSCNEYITKSVTNGYTFGVTKVCPKELENERNLNYQFIQSYDLTDEDIDKLVKPTMDEIHEVLGGDWRKMILFLKGSGLKEDNADRLDDDIAKAVMINQEVANDPYVVNTVYQMIHNRINEAKVGVLKVHGNYSILSGDPYALCQSIFGMDVTGLLYAGEIYNKYWHDLGVEKVACFRAPMTCHNNIRLFSIAYSDDEDYEFGEGTDYWYRYMPTTTILNAWDTTMAALNGADFDGDLVMLTDNEVLVSKLKEQPALMCAQRKAVKRISTEEDFVQSNIDSFGNDIGQTTNWITSMFEVRSQYEIGSKEYEALSYRIKCGQLYQQNAIDKAKGIICKPMPRSWHDRHTVNKMEDGGEKTFYRSIVADKKPYFMRYIYPALMRQYNTYIKNTDRNALREFQMTVDELKSLDQSELTERQREFLRYFDLRLPVGNNDCIMNKICRLFENEFDGFIGKQHRKTDFDYSILKGNEEYSSSQFYAIKKLYEDYNKHLQNYKVFSDYERVDEYDMMAEMQMIDDDFRRQCEFVCPNRLTLCNILLDLCYRKSSTKRFVWGMCSHEIIHNLLESNDNIISIPVSDEEGDFTYCGDRYSVKTVKLSEKDEGD